MARKTIEEKKQKIEADVAKLDEKLKENARKQKRLDAKMKAEHEQRINELKIRVANSLLDEDCLDHLATAFARMKEDEQNEAIALRPDLFGDFQPTPEPPAENACEKLVGLTDMKRSLAQEFLDPDNISDLPQAQAKDRLDVCRILKRDLSNQLQKTKDISPIYTERIKSDIALIDSVISAIWEHYMRIISFK